VKDAHFATYPPDLIEPCILAGCPEGGTVMDCCAGSGTTGLAAIKHGRKFLGIEPNADYIKIADKRLREHFSLFASAREEVGAGEETAGVVSRSADVLEASA
jgi:DNA modification methylase